MRPAATDVATADLPPRPIASAARAPLWCRARFVSCFAIGGPERWSSGSLPATGMVVEERCSDTVLRVDAVGRLLWLDWRAGRKRPISGDPWRGLSQCQDQQSASVSTSMRGSAVPRTPQLAARCRRNRQLPQSAHRNSCCVIKQPRSEEINEHILSTLLRIWCLACSAAQAQANPFVTGTP